MDKKMKIRNLFSMFVAAVLVVAATQSAKAALVITISDGVNPDIVVADGDAADSNTNAGAVTLVAQSLGTFSLNITSSISSSPVPFMLLDVSGVTTTAAGTITISATDDEFEANSSAGLVSIFTTNLTSNNPTVSGSQLLSSDGGDLLIEHDGVNFSSQETKGASGPFSNPFSLTETLVFTFARPTVGGALHQADITSQVIPAPAALPAGLALLGFVAAKRRRRA